MNSQAVIASHFMHSSASLLMSSQTAIIHLFTQSAIFRLILCQGFGQVHLSANNVSESTDFPVKVSTINLCVDLDVEHSFSSISTKSLIDMFSNNGALNSVKRRAMNSAAMHAPKYCASDSACGVLCDTRFVLLPIACSVWSLD
eukprot:6455307-Amphidinium_carterae.3